MISKLLPVFLGFAAAFAAKKLGLLKADHGNLLLRVGLYITIPALIFVSVAKLGLTHSLLIFPLLSVIILAVTFPVTSWIAKRLKLTKPTEGTFRVAPLTINSGFVLPFMAAAFGGEGATRVVLFNAGYNPLLLIGVYGLAASYNPGNKRRRDVLKRVLALPPLWALVLGVLVNVSDTTVPATLNTTLSVIGNATILLLPVALGLLFSPERLRFNKTLAILGLRMGVGLLLGVAISVVLGLEGMDRAAVLSLAAAPIGFNLLTFSAVEKLDQELAASAVSLSLMVALVLTPAIILLAG